jgi:hypothetical protein
MANQRTKAMTISHPQQLDHAQCACQDASANVLQFHGVNFLTHLHSYFHQARKIMRDNFQEAVQEHVNELSFSPSQALPLVRTRIPRLAQISPLDMGNLVRQSRDDCEMTCKTSDGISRRKSEQWQWQRRRMSVKAACKESHL